MKRIGLVTDHECPRLSESDQQVVEPLKREGFEAVSAEWDNPRQLWEQFDALIFRSCWNYPHHYQAFLNWLKQIEILGIPMFNPPDIIRWNSQKTYLKDLEKGGIPIIPTIYIQKDMVVKPIIGTSAYNVTRLQATDCIVQPFLPEITSVGEYSFVFINKKFSHAILKKPKKGEFRTNYRFGPTETLITPDDNLVTQAANILQKVKSPLLYARVDGINSNDQFILMELELIEPRLYFDFYPEAAKTLARALKKMYE